METILSFKREIRLDTKRCFVCQKRKNPETLVNAKDNSILKLKEAAEKRKALGEVNDIFERIDTYLLNETASNIKWHKDCYGNFTKAIHVQRLETKKTAVVNQKKEINPESSSGMMTRSKVPTFNFDICAFCQDNSSTDTLSRTSQLSTSDFIKCNSKFNLNLHIALSTVIDCPARDLLYHLKCYSKFKKFVDKSKKEETHSDYAFIYILQELEHAANKGDVFLIDDVWDRYEYLAKEYNTNSVGSYKTKHTFCISLKNKVNNSFHFVNKLADRKTIMYPIKHMNEGISSIVLQNDKEIEESIIPKYHPEYRDELLALIHVALRLRGDIMEQKVYSGISVTENAAIDSIPESLHMFLSVLFGGQEILDLGENEDYECGKWTKNVKMSIAQDMVFGVSKGKNIPPKQLGLASTVHQKTRSKDLVNLLWTLGHGANYETLLKLDATLANDTLSSLDEKTGAVIPQNLVPGGGLIQFTADNIDIKDGGSLDGKNTFNACQMAAFQRNDGVCHKPFSHIEKISKKQAICVPHALTNIEKTIINNEKISPIDEYSVNVDLFDTSDTTGCYSKATAEDNAFYFSRQKMNQRIGWTEFNQKDNKTDFTETTVGHMPMILNPASEYDTLNVVVRRCVAISKKFGQKYTVITVDQQLYCKLHVLISNISDFRSVVIPRLGGFHISLNFLRIIGQHMSDCGLHEAWIESKILGEVAAQKVFAGKDYNKGMRVHKLTKQALWRILIPRFLTFLKGKNPKMAESIEEEMNKLRDEEKCDIDLKLLFNTVEWKKYLDDFVKQECCKSVNFSYWWKYMEMVSTLLMFTRAQRDGLWDLYLLSFKKIIPFFFQYDHQNYARWGVIYAAQMMQIPVEIKEEFVRGNFVVKGSNQKFCQVDPDQAQEWLNRIYKIAGGIVGITKTNSALMKWCLSFNARSFIADQTYSMLGLRMDKLVTKETMDARKSRDNTDEDALLKQLEAFNILGESSSTLINIATKDLATAEIQESLLNAEINGKTHMEKFLNNIIAEDTGKIIALEFYNSIERNNSKTFQHLYMKTVRSKEKNEKFAYKADRKTLVRIITAKHLGLEVDLGTILCSEIIPVPLSLADINGNLRSGDKSNLQKRLLEDIDCRESINLDNKPSCLIIDGQALVCSIGKAKECENFGHLADKFRNSVLSQGASYARIDVVFDRYRENSIKESTRDRRALKQKAIRKLIDSRSVTLPHDWANFLASSENKSDYANFLSTEIKRQSQYDKEIVTAGGFKNELEVWASRDIENISELCSTQEEADTRLILHAINCNFKYIVVSSRDTDVLILLVSHFHRMNCIELWMMCGTQKKPKYIPVHEIVKNLSSNTLKALIPFHTLTGCDTTSYLAQHTKWTAWEHLKSDLGSGLIQNLGEDCFGDLDLTRIEKFFCILYGMPKEDDINKVRLHLFLKNKIPEALPPTKDALYLHIKRAHYQSLIWKKANFPDPSLPEALAFGWKVTETGRLKPILMTKDAIPDDELKFTSCSCTTGCNTNRCGCRKLKLTCSINCKCADDNVVCCTNTPDVNENEDEVDDYLNIMP